MTRDNLASGLKHLDFGADSVCGDSNPPAAISAFPVCFLLLIFFFILLSISFKIHSLHHFHAFQSFHLSRSQLLKHESQNRQSIVV
jgi:hypothetical protein